MIGWTTVVWSMVAASCLTLAMIHLLVWLRNRARPAHAWFSLLTSSQAAFAGFELALMHCGSVTEYVRLHQLAHIPMCLIVVSMVGFIHTYLETGRMGLLWTILGLRALILFLNFFPGPTFNFEAILSLESFEVFGDLVAVAVGEPRPWARLGEFSALLLLIFVIDAAIRHWRINASAKARQRAVVVGGSVLACTAITLTFSILYHTGQIQLPYMISLTFMLIIAGMGHELSRDLIEADRLSNELRKSTETIHLAAEAAKLALWSWDVTRNEIEVNPHGRKLYGISDGERITLDRFLKTVHPDDRTMVSGDIEQAMQGGGYFASNYRVLPAAGVIRWIEATGRVLYDPQGNVIEMRGVSIDATQRTEAEHDAQILKRDLAHASRVTLLGQLSLALAHELSQPLGAILRNSEAAGMILQSPQPDLEELREIIKDIHSDDRRAGAVVERLRSLLKRRDLRHERLSITELLNEVCSLVRTDASARRISIIRDLPRQLPEIDGDRVHLLQVLLNLVVNAMDSIDQSGSVERKIFLSAGIADDQLLITVRDTGPGVAPHDLERIFEPFHTTKEHGMGMGLTVCRTILDAHQGTLDALTESGGGEFRVSLPLP